ncbi:MAG: hypothetical protein JSS49_29345 [Planctomycetes bacterium]|nr:hypothetical protein [Planctomycetota bacterium]
MAINSQSTPFTSLEDLRTEHGRLLRASKESSGATDADTETVADKIVRFLARARATGARLDYPSDREAAQSVLDYWTASLFTLPNGVCAAQALPSAIPGVTSDAVNLQLEPFDPSTIDDVMKVADTWLNGPDADQVLARRLMLHLLRLSADKPEFDVVPTIRGALYDLDAVELVDQTIEGLVRAGVARVTRGETKEMDRVALRTPDLILRWATLKKWCDERREFRHRVEQWNAAGRPDADLASDAALDEARQYHDRNKLERDFVNASADQQARNLKQAAVDRRAKVAWSILALLALAGWFFTAVNIDASRRNASRAEKNSVIASDNARKAENNAREAKTNAAEARKNAIEAKKAQKEAEDRKEELERRRQLTDLRRLVRALAEVVTASDVDQHVLALQKWDKLVDEIGREEPFHSSLDFDSLRKTVTDPTTANLSPSDLNRIRTLRNKLIEGSDLDDSIKLGREQSFALVEVSVRGIYDTLQQGKPVSEAEPFIREFWTQYWGEMLLFEGGDVETQMVAFGQVLREIQAEAEVPRAELKASVEKFSTEYLKGGMSEFTSKVRRLTPAAFTQLQQEYKNIPADAYNTLLNEVTSHKVSSGLVKRLNDQQIPLLRALDKERRGTQSPPAKSNLP